MDKKRKIRTVKPDLEFMTSGEMLLFLKLRKDGRITFFRCTVCLNCGVEIPKPKKYCCKKCLKQAERHKQ